MRDAILFVLIMLATLGAYMIVKLGSPTKWPGYFRTPDGLGILRGIVLALVAMVVLGGVLALFPSKAHAGEWLTEASVFAGIDYTKKLSPQCEANAVDDRGTSNLGVRLNLWRSDSQRVRVNSKYTHHSCALGVDDRQYDAVGLEVELIGWKR